MSVYYGENRTNQRATPPVQSVINMSLGKVHVIYDEYDASASGASVAAGSTIEMGKAIPLGWKCIGMGKLVFAGGSTGGTMTVGDAQDADRYLESTSVATDGSADLDADAGAGYAPTGAETNDDQQVVITVGGATFAGTVKMALLVVGPN